MRCAWRWRRCTQTDALRSTSQPAAWLPFGDTGLTSAVGHPAHPLEPPPRVGGLAGGHDVTIASAQRQHHAREPTAASWLPSGVHTVERVAAGTSMRIIEASLGFSDSDSSRLGNDKAFANVGQTSAVFLSAAVAFTGRVNSPIPAQLLLVLVERVAVDASPEKWPPLSLAVLKTAHRGSRQPKEVHMAATAANSK